MRFPWFMASAATLGGAVGLDGGRSKIHRNARGGQDAGDPRGGRETGAIALDKIRAQARGRDELIAGTARGILPHPRSPSVDSAVGPETTSRPGPPLSPARRISLIVAALLGAALFVRLGFWQLDRRAERAAANAARGERLAEPTLDWTASPPPADSAGVVWRRARVTGRWDPANEIILRSRSDPDGRPGVELLTPLLVEPDLALLVLRGWLPAADGLRADLALGWPSGVPGGPVTVEGVVIPPSEGRGGQPVEVEAAGGMHVAIAGIDVPLVADRLPYRVLAYPLRADDSGRQGLPRPPREIALDAGSHLSYAIQWFAFAAITLVGTTILLRKERGA